ncbi:MAG: NUDIX hydrolase [Candidatus Wildermuthbacteria bacterium]|nr:NUDIX hydrolase [Candidatus Wildermuthbacteria bacterium]
MELQVGVKALLKNKDGKYLLVRRSSEKYPEVGARWDIVGGRINPGTTLIENLKREIKEEVGLDLIEEPRLVAAQDILRIEGRHVVRLTYLGAIEGQPKLDGDHTEFNWFTMEEIKKLENLDIYFKELIDTDKFYLTGALGNVQ